MADDSSLSGSDIRSRFRQSDTTDGGDRPPATSAAPGTGASIRERFRNADATTTTTQTQTKPNQIPLVSEYGDLGNAWWNTQAQPPAGQEEARIPFTAVVGGNAPGYTQSDVLPLARRTDVINDPNAHWWQGWALAPGPFRALGQTPGENVQIDPSTNALSLTPEATVTASFAANPLSFSRGAPLLREAPGTLTKPLAPTAAELTASVLRADQQPAPPAAPPSAAAPSPSPTPTPSAGPPSGVWVPAEAGRTYPADWQTRVNRDTGRPEVFDPTRGSPAPSSGAAAPPPAGAQVTPATQAGLTPDQARAYGSTADKQWLYSSQQPGVRDTTEYFPGDTPTLAEREQTVQAARDQKTQRNISPAAAQAEQEFLHERSEQRKSVFQQTAGSDATQDAAINEANTNINNGLSAAFRAGGRVDPQGIADAINAEFQTSGGKLPPVRAAMRDVSAALQKDDGTGMETDPQAVYQVRRVINYLQSREGKQANPGYGSGDVQAALARVKDAIDTAIEPAAPGFRQAISDYATAQRAIEAREFLQAEEPKLYDSRGNMNYVKFHNFMQRVITMRDPRMPPNAAQSLTDAQMTTLKGLHDSLRRSASADDLAKARGSDTAQNLMDIARQAISGVGGDVAAGVIGGLSQGPAGMIIGPMVKRGVGEFLTARGQARATARMQNLLRPNPAQYPTAPNPLIQPPQP